MSNLRALGVVAVARTKLVAGMELGPVGGD